MLLLSSDMLQLLWLMLLWLLPILLLWRLRSPTPTSTELLMTTPTPTSMLLRLLMLLEMQGSYSVALPDGRIQNVKYTSDNYNGYVADVSYEGTPVYPPAPVPVA